jgi:hypothetical protein
MGFYVETPNSRGKAEYLIEEHDAVHITREEAEEIVSDPKSEYAVIVVLNNVMFEAAGYAYDKRELGHFLAPDDPRPKVCLAVDKKVVQKLTGCTR